jgi:uncharacterized RmlC-like cupin family protein
MPAARPVVLHPNERVAEASTPGLAIHHYLGGDGRWVGFAGWVHNHAGDTSGWHHHADNDTYVYVVRGWLRVDFGASGTESVIAGAGDFIVIPSRTIHHETTSPDGDLDAFVFRVGGEPERVDVDGPAAPND